MKTLVQIELKNYWAALEDWKRRDGLFGGGGKWDARKREYNPAPPPMPDGLSPFEAKLFQAVRTEVLK